jgi:hypothetical protein
MQRDIVTIFNSVLANDYKNRKKKWLTSSYEGVVSRKLAAPSFTN